MTHLHVHRGLAATLAVLAVRFTCDIRVTAGNRIQSVPVVTAGSDRFGAQVQRNHAHTVGLIGEKRAAWFAASLLLGT